MAKVISTIKFRRNTATNWTAGNPILQSGEPGFETDTKKIKIGDGTTDWVTLPYTTEIGSAMSNLDDVVITGPVADNELVAYSSATSKWINKTASEAGLQPAGSYASASHTHFATDISSYTTSGTGASDNNKWTKFASVTLTAQYQDSESVVQFVSGGDGATTVAGAKIRIKVKQQTALGTNPYVHIAVEQGANLAPANFYATIVQNTPSTVVDFYIQIPETYRAYRFYPIVTYGTISWLQSQVWAASVPAGLATVAALADFGTVYGAFSGNITGDITGNVTGNVSGTAGSLSPGANINGQNFTGASAITIKASTTNVLTFGTYLTGTSFDGSAAVTLGTNATDANTVSTLVARNASGNFSAGIITANNYKVSLTTAASDTVALDFTSGNGLVTRAAAATVTFTGANYSAGSTITARVVAGAAIRTLVFPAGWVFVGSKPASIAASKSGILTVTSFGTTEADCIASWVAQL